MYVPKRLVTLAFVSLLALASLAFALSASGGNGDRDGSPLLRSTLAPSVPTDPAIHGVLPGGVPWVLEKGSVRLKSDGRLDVRLKGLVIPTTGTAGAVTSISASLYCAPDSSAAVATTATAPLSSDGDGRIRAQLTLPSSCLAPAVLIHPNGNATRYIAATGFKS